jgi:hypothetical protein
MTEWHEEHSNLLGSLSQRFVPFVLVLRPSSSSSDPCFIGSRTRTKDDDEDEKTSGSPM